jgi:serine-type D-Ala-D-Ala carboxypeptidase (penicillin-binding protein 5/6)
VFSTPEYTVNSSALEATNVSADAWVLFDAETGEVLAGKETEKVVPIASVTKLITAETALNNAYNLDSTTTISWRATATEGTTGKLATNEKIQARELLFPLLLESSNDAAEAIAEHVKRDVFIADMNKRVAVLGMTHTSLADPSGLSPKNVSSASDLRILIEHLYQNHHHILDITRLTTFVGAKHVWQNNNPVFSSNGFIGGKQGFTNEAGRTFGGVFEERFSTDIVRPIGLIILGSDKMLDDIATLREALHEHVDFGYTVK